MKQSKRKLNYLRGPRLFLWPIQSVLCLNVTNFRMEVLVYGFYLFKVAYANTCKMFDWRCSCIIFAYSNCAMVIRVKFMEELRLNRSFYPTAKR